MMCWLNRTMRRFVRDRTGAVVVDHIPVFFALIVIVLLIFEIGVAYFLVLRSHKAAQLGARLAATLPAVHADVPDRNTRVNALGRLGEPCFDANNPNSSRCVDPGGPWVCRGSSLVGKCNSTVFDQIVADMQRTFPDLTSSAVTISYINRDLGQTGGRFIPEVNVSIEPHAYEFVIFSLGRNDPKNSAGGELVNHGSTRYSGVTASAFAEDLSGG